MRGFLARAEVGTLYIEPGSPWQNGYAESFHSKLRGELLDAEVFADLAGAGSLAAGWKNGYNHRPRERPHPSLGYRTPAEYAASLRPAPVGDRGMRTAVMGHLCRTSRSSPLTKRCAIVAVVTATVALSMQRQLRHNPGRGSRETTRDFGANRAESAWWTWRTVMSQSQSETPARIGEGRTPCGQSKNAAEGSRRRSAFTGEPSRSATGLKIAGSGFEPLTSGL